MEDDLVDYIIESYASKKYQKPTIYEYNNELTFENGVLKFTKYATFETLTTQIRHLNGIAPTKVKVIDYTEISDVLVGKPYSLMKHFGDLKELVEIKFGINFDTSKVDDMAYMFQFCSSIESIDLSSFNTSNVKTMRGMFCGCRELERIIFGIDFNASNVTDMSRMFFSCESLKSLDLSTFNASCVLDMTSMFYDCKSLETLDMSSFTSNHVQHMGYMFGFCERLKSINMVNISYSLEHTNVAENMFYMCEVLSSVIMDLNNYHSAIEHQLHQCRRSAWWHGTRNSVRPPRRTRQSQRARLSVATSGSENEVFNDASSSSSSSSHESSSSSSHETLPESLPENLPESSPNESQDN